jgi:hypothetical protein
MIAAVVLVATLGYARSSSAISLVPPTLEFSSQAGQTVTGKIKIYNDEKDFKTFYLSTANFTAGGEGGEPKFNFQTDVSDLASWMTFDADKVELQPGATASVGVTITIPKVADPGGHYAGVFFGSTPPEKGTVKIEQRTGTLVILRVEGAVREAATIQSFTSATGKSVFSRLPVGLVLRIQNTGNVHFRPKGTVTIRNMFGGVTTTIDINPKEGAVLPNSVRKFDLLWKKDSDDSKSKGFFGEIGEQWNNFALGGYTAQVDATYGTTNQTLTNTFHLTIFPWQLLLVIALGLAIVIVLIVLGVKAYNASIIAKAQASKPASSPTSKRPPLQ